MNRAHLTTRLGYALSTLGLALLTACGGGGTDSTVSTPEVPATPAAATTVCGMTPVVTSVPAGEELSTLEENVPMVINSYNALISRISSATGYPYDIGGSPLLKLPMEDLREVMAGHYSPQNTSNTMGVELSGPRLAAGSVGCVAGISRVFSDGGDGYHVSLSSAELVNLPTGDLVGTAVNGFELMHNFSSTSATAVFRMATADLADPNAAQICHINRTGTTCSTPVVSEDLAHSQWVLQLPITEAGIYVLTADREQVPLD